MWGYDYKTARDNPYHEEPFVRISHMSYVDNLPRWGHPWHAHKMEYELAFIVKGKGDILVGERKLRVELGTVVLIRPEVPHHFSSEDSDEMQYCTLRFEDTGHGELARYFSGCESGAVLVNVEFPYILSSIHRLFRLHENNGGIADAAFQITALGLIVLAKALFPQDDSMVPEPGDLAGAIMDYIADHYSEKLTLESLAEQFYVSASHLSRIFYQRYQISPINYLIYRRISRAAILLQETKLSVAEISSRVGYDNQAHFTKLFTRRIGCPPLEFRERNENSPMGSEDYGKDHG